MSAVCAPTPNCSQKKGTVELGECGLVQKIQALTEDDLQRIDTWALQISAIPAWSNGMQCEYQLRQSGSVLFSIERFGHGLSQSDPCSLITICMVLSDL